MEGSFANKLNCDSTILTESLSICLNESIISAFFTSPLEDLDIDIVKLIVSNDVSKMNKFLILETIED